MLRINADAGVGTLDTTPATLDTIGRRLGTPLTGADLLARYRDTATRVRAIYDAGLARLAD